MSANILSLIAGAGAAGRFVIIDSDKGSDKTEDGAMM
jgi:hypothetical protein